MNLIKHVLLILLLDAGAVLAFGHDPAPAPGLALCQSPEPSGTYPARETDPRTTRTSTEQVHENQ